MRPRSFGAVLYQSLLGALVFLIIAELGWLTGHNLLVFPLGASIFMAFAIPGSNCARRYAVVAGYAAGTIAGLLAYWLLAFTPVNWAVLARLVGALAVFLTITLMALIRAEHPPAAAMALTVVLIGLDRYYLLAALGGVVLLVLVAQIFKRRLVDLF